MFGQQINRIEPAMGPGSYRTYQILQPLATHFRPATCAEVGCPHHLGGWCTVVDETTDLGQRQAHYIRRVAGRGYTESRDAGLTTFAFEAGQRCFAADQHRVQVGRPQIYVRRDGDWRANPRGTDPLIHARAADWVDDFGEHQQRIVDQIEKG